MISLFGPDLQTFQLGPNRKKCERCLGPRSGNLVWSKEVISVRVKLNHGSVHSQCYLSWMVWTFGPITGRWGSLSSPIKQKEEKELEEKWSWAAVAHGEGQHIGPTDQSKVILNTTWTARLQTNQCEEGRLSPRRWWRQDLDKSS